jgi:hypothetical protein
MKRKFSVYQTQARQAVGGSQSDFGSARSLWGNKGAPKQYIPMLGYAHDGVESGERGDAAPEVLAAREKQGLFAGTPSDFQTVASGLGTDQQTRELAMKMGYSHEKVGDMEIDDLRRELHIRFGSGTADVGAPGTEDEAKLGLKAMGTIFPMGAKPGSGGLGRMGPGVNPAPILPGAAGIPGGSLLSTPGTPPRGTPPPGTPTLTTTIGAPTPGNPTTPPPNAFGTSFGLGGAPPTTMLAGSMGTPGTPGPSTSLTTPRPSSPGPSTPLPKGRPKSTPRTPRTPRTPKK